MMRFPLLQRKATNMTMTSAYKSERSEIVTEGYNAYFAGKDMFSNPYDDSHKGNYGAWQQGFLQAYREWRGIGVDRDSEA